MERMTPEPGAKLLQTGLHPFRQTAFDVHGNAIVQVACLGALEPDVLATDGFLGHGSTSDRRCRPV